MIRFVLPLCAMVALAACREDGPALPAPVPMTAAAVGYYCQMDLLEHPGPKAQVHLLGLTDPLFFSQVRDAVAYRRMPEQSGRVLAIYVSDMGAAPSWDAPGPENWINAEAALFVVGATLQGGMGAPELVPFGDAGAAERFVATHGGTIMKLSEIADSEVLAPVELRNGASASDDAEYQERLRKLNPKAGG